MKFVVRNRNEFINIAARVGELFDSGKPLTVTIKKFQRPRTTDQNAKVHVMFRDLALHTGHSPEEIKEYFKAEFGPVKQVAIAGKTKTIPMGSSEWDVETCSLMIEQLYRVGAECGCNFEDT